MRTLPLILIVSACAGTPCVRDYASVEPAHECLALNCADADSVEEWTEEVVDPETGGTTKTNYATCQWDCVGLASGKRARVTQEYVRVQGPDECVVLLGETIDTRRADCDRECEQTG